jgi:hypothetical protein
LWHFFFEFASSASSTSTAPIRTSIIKLGEMVFVLLFCRHFFPLGHPNAHII